MEVERNLVGNVGLNEEETTHALQYPVGKFQEIREGKGGWWLAIVGLGWYQIELHKRPSTSRAAAQETEYQKSDMDTGWV